MKRFVFALMLVFLIIVPTHAQCDEATIAEAVELLTGQLENVETQQDLVIFGMAVGAIIQGCQGQETTATDSTGEETSGLSRANPVSFGEWFPFERGQVRVASVDTGIELPSWSGFQPDEGDEVVAVNLEYLCELEDPDETCRGIEVASQATYVTAHGTIIEEAPIYLEDNIGVQGHEAYPGVTITGRIYFSLPTNESLALMRLQLPVNNRTEPVFFALGEVAKSE